MGLEHHSVRHMLLYESFAELLLTRDQMVDLGIRQRLDRSFFLIGKLVIFVYQSGVLKLL